MNMTAATLQCLSTKILQKVGVDLRFDLVKFCEEGMFQKIHRHLTHHNECRIIKKLPHRRLSLHPILYHHKHQTRSYMEPLDSILVGHGPDVVGCHPLEDVALDFGDVVGHQQAEQGVAVGVHGGGKSNGQTQEAECVDEWEGGREGEEREGGGRGRRELKLRKYEDGFSLFPPI